MKFARLFSGATAASVIAAMAVAHSGATGVVKERMDGMDVMKDAVKVIAPMMKGQTAYDSATIKKAAQDIGKHAGQPLLTLFPEGSVHGPSEALPSIWEDWQAFVDLALRLEELADGLAAASANGFSKEDPASSQSSMMGTSMMGTASADTASVNDIQTLAQMPADRVFTLMSQTCSACHTRFRKE
ncbi:c-type cytochrome [Primorskyibacter sp. S87]|uniref:c-type cytochrome n=1 Tax=Primorskyibacter sp. S87 TaxID=3415126 RepID=UPI003C7E2475